MSAAWDSIGRTGEVDLAVFTEGYFRERGAVGEVPAFLCILSPAGGAQSPDDVTEFSSPSVTSLRVFVDAMRPRKIVCSVGGEGDYRAGELVELLRAKDVH